MPETYRTLNPTTGGIEEEFPLASVRDVETTLETADRGFASWRRLSFAQRSAYLKKVAGVLGEQRESLARLMTLEMGKPIGQARLEVDKCALVCLHYADRAESYLKAHSVDNERVRGEVLYRPLGPILAVMPWNFPLWQVFRFAAPHLMAGNVGVLKHAPNVPQCALAIEGVFRAAGLEDGVFQSIFVNNETAASIIADRRVAAVTLTGSPRAGKSVAQTAGQHLKKVVLELGGSDPYVVLEDADLEMAAETCASSRLLNTGQSCIAAKRFIVVEQVAEAFLELFGKALSARKVGDPAEDSTDVGPMAREDLRDHLAAQVEQSKNKGARVVMGGASSLEPGFFYPPTLLAEVEPGMPAFDEELFGPVAAVIRAADESAACQYANQTVYGLGAGIFSRDEERARGIARERLDAGSVAVNGFVRSDPEMPFGGIKSSGFGRELGRQGILEFVNVKSVTW